jgi:hypothetical protein
VTKFGIKTPKGVFQAIDKQAKKRSLLDKKDQEREGSLSLTPISSN